jgi:integrase
MSGSNRQLSLFDLPGHEPRLLRSNRKRSYRDPHKKFDSVREYLDSLKKPRRTWGNSWDLQKIAKACGIKISEVRGSLPRLGYEKTVNKHGLISWRLNQ